MAKIEKIILLLSQGLTLSQALTIILFFCPQPELPQPSGWDKKRPPSEDGDLKPKSHEKKLLQ